MNFIDTVIEDQVLETRRAVKTRQIRESRKKFRLGMRVDRADENQPGSGAAKLFESLDRQRPRPDQKHPSNRDVLDSGVRECQLGAGEWALFGGPTPFVL